jgi:hypothetical protein
MLEKEKIGAHFKSIQKISGMQKEEIGLANGPGRQLYQIVVAPKNALFQVCCTFVALERLGIFNPQSLLKLAHAKVSILVIIKSWETYCKDAPRPLTTNRGTRQKNDESVFNSRLLS